MDNPAQKRQEKLFKTLESVLIGNNQALVMFLVCLLISTIIWFLNALGKTYTATFSHQVEYMDIPRNKFILNDPPEALNLTVSAHGFTLFRYKISRPFSPVKLNVSGLVSESAKTSQGLYLISTQLLKPALSSQLRSGIQLIEIKPEVFSLVLDSLGVREVPVASKVRFEFKPSYGLTSDIEFRPGIVTVTGPRQNVEKTDTVYTVLRVFKNQSISQTSKIALEIPDNVIVDPPEVTMIARIDQFTEKRMKVPVWVDNQPDNLKVRLFPYEVEVSFPIGVSNYQLIRPEDFSLFVSWEDIRQNLPELQVQVKKLPPGLKSVEITPEKVEYLIEKN